MVIYTTNILFCIRVLLIVLVFNGDYLTGYYVAALAFLCSCSKIVFTNGILSVQVQKKRFTADTTIHTASPSQESPSHTASHDASSKSHDISSQMNSHSDMISDTSLVKGLLPTPTDKA